VSWWKEGGADVAVVIAKLSRIMLAGITLMGAEERKEKTPGKKAVIGR